MSPQLQARLRRGLINRRLLVVATGIATIVGLQLYEPPPELMAGSSAELARKGVPVVQAADAAKGTSGEVRMRFVRAGEAVAFPLAIASDASGSVTGFHYRWVNVDGRETGDSPRALVGDTLLSPLQPGFYELVVSRWGIEQHITEPRLAVIVPFELKLGSSLHGYRIGHYPAEWSHADGLDLPTGFAEVQESDLELQLTKHIKVRDFLTHDTQTIWPRYAAIDPRVLDKIELVLNELARRRGDDQIVFRMDVHSGFRTPDHNADVEGAARDSRHLYGDAADVAIDADGDGKLTIFDAYRVESAVDWVERQHPELAGGLGVYSSPRFPSPYTHIDARGERKRWRG